MGRRDKKYANNTRTLKRGKHPDYGGKSTTDNLVFGGALPEQKEEGYDWTKSPLGKVMMAVYEDICWTYFCIMKRFPWQKKQNQLEKQAQEAETDEEVLTDA